MQAFARGSKKEPVFGKIQKSFFVKPRERLRSDTSSLAPLAAELIQPTPAHPVVVAHPPSLSYSHNSHIVKRTARSPVLQPGTMLALLARAWEGR